MEATVKFFGKSYGFLTAGEADYFFNMAGFREPTLRNGAVLYLPSKLEVTCVCTGTRVTILQHQHNPKGLCATEWTLASMVEGLSRQLHCLLLTTITVSDSQDREHKAWLRTVESTERVLYVGTAEECNCLNDNGHGRVVPITSVSLR